MSRVEVTIERARLRRYLELVGGMIGYRFSNADWDAVSYALGSDSRLPYDHPLAGRMVALARIHLPARQDRIRVEIVSNHESEERIRVIDTRSDAEMIDYVRSAFAGAPRPDHFTNHTHCAECAEHDETMRRFTPDTITLEALGFETGWSPMAFLTADGYRYYFPAFVRLSFAPLRESYFTELVEYRLPGPGDRQTSTFTAGERAAVAAFLNYVSLWREDLCCELHEPLWRSGATELESLAASWHAEDPQLLGQSHSNKGAR